MKKTILLVFLCTWYLILPISSQIQQRPEIAKGQFLPAPEGVYSKTHEERRLKSIPNTLFLEDFEFETSLWSLSGNWQIGNPGSGPFGGYESSNCAATNLDGYYSNNANDWLISPVIDLPNEADQLLLIIDEWFNLESGYDYGLIKISTDEGATWTQLAVSNGTSNWRETTVDISSYRGESVLIGFHLTSDGSIVRDGWYIDNVRIEMIPVEPLKVQMSSLNTQNFPFVYMNVAVESYGDGITSLDISNFRVYENDVLQTDLFEVTPPASGGGQRLADIVFCVDVTGSMSEEINAVKENMLSFINALADSDINYNIGFVTFGDIVHVYNDYNLYSDQNLILSIVNGITLGEYGIGSGDDWPENQFGAMAEGAQFNFRPGAQRIQIMITDAHSHSGNHVTPWTMESLINDVLLPNNIIVFPVIDVYDNLQLNQYVPIANATNPKGTYFYIFDNFNAILEEIGAILGSTYVIRYRSGNADCNGELRIIDIRVYHDGNEAFTIGEYIPCQYPNIQRSPETIALHDQSWAENTAFTIKVDVTDDFEPYVNSVKFFYRTTGNATYNVLSMTNTDGSRWVADIPSESVITPGFDYYITGNDGVHTVSDPPNNPSDYPYQLAILPNIAPEINHTPQACYNLGHSLVISAEITDNTNELVQQKLFYRRHGQLLYQSVDMLLVGGNIFSAEIPSGYSVVEGIEYFISAWDDFGLRTDHGTFSNPHFIEVCKEVYPSGGIYIKVVETSGLGMVNSVGYEYSSWSSSSLITGSTVSQSSKINKFYIDEGGFVFITPPITGENEILINDFNDKLLLFDETDRQIGHISFSYSFEYEGMNSRHVVLFLHNDGDIFGGDPGDNNRYFPYHRRSPSNPTNQLGIKVRYSYYKDGEYPVSILIPPHFRKNEISDVPEQGYRFPLSYNNVIPVVFVHGLKGTFSYQSEANPQRSSEGDQVSYWYDTERKVNSIRQSGLRKYHAWQFYYPNEDDLVHCGMMLKTAVEYLQGKYLNKINFVAHSMGGLVTMEYLTREGNYNPNRIGRVIISMSPLHGSLMANRLYDTNYGLDVGFISRISPLLEFDGKAPCYRDLSVGSDFLSDFHEREWPEELVNNTINLIGLTKNDFPSPAKHLLLTAIHTEAFKHQDGVVSYSSASLLTRGIGFAGIYGNHHDGKYNKILGNDEFHEEFIDSFMSDSSSDLKSFEDYCLGENSVSVFVRGDKQIIKPAGLNQIEEIDINKGDVDFRKGMVTVSASSSIGSKLYFYRRRPVLASDETDYILSHILRTTNLLYEYRLEGYFARNRSALGRPRYIFSRLYLPYKSFVDFNSYAEYPDNVDVTLLNYISRPSGYGVITTIDGSYLHHQNVFIEDERPSDVEVTESSPTKISVPGIKSSQHVIDIYVDDQTTLAEFILYSYTADYYDIPYYITLLSPDASTVDSTSTGIEYFRNPDTGSNILTVPDPLPGRWQVFANLDDGEDKEIDDFTGIAKFASGIKATSLIENEVVDINKPFVIRGFIKMPDITKVTEESLNTYVEVKDTSGISEFLQLDNIEVTDSGFMFINTWQVDSAGLYSYTMIFEGEYNGFRFERAVHGSFSAEDLSPVFIIPDQQLDIRNRLVDLILPRFFHCSWCDPEFVTFEVELISSTFDSDELFYNYSEENTLLSVIISDKAPIAEALFSVNAFSDNTLISNTTFVVSSFPLVPTDLSVFGVTAKSAKLAWSGLGLESKWDILYGPSGFDPGTEGAHIEDVTSIPHILEGLSRSSIYDFYVRASFDGDGKISAWSEYYTFATNHVITSSSGHGGSIEPEGEIEVRPGRSMDFLILPDLGYHCSNILINEESKGIFSEYRFENVNNSQTIYAEFSKNVYEVSAGSLPEDAGHINGAGEYEHGDEVTLSAAPAAGYNFVNWSENDEIISTDSVFVFIAESHRDIKANFDLNKYYINVTVQPEEGGSVTGDGEYFHGDNVNLSAIPETGYHFEGFIEDSIVLHTSDLFSFTAVSDRSIIAQFQLSKYTITYMVMDADTGEEIADAIIHFDGIQHDAGQYYFEEIEPGTYYYIVEKEGYFGINDSVDITNSDEIVNVSLELDVTGLADAALADIKVYPNPSENLLMVEFDNLSSSEINVILYNMQGRVMKILPVKEQGRVNLTLNLTGLAPGSYILVLKSEGEFQFYNVIKAQ